jgi:hypothetical protein
MSRDVETTIARALRAHLAASDPGAHKAAGQIASLLYADIMFGPLRPGEDLDGDPVPDDYETGLYADRLKAIVEGLPGYFDADAGNLLTALPDEQYVCDCPDCDGAGYLDGDEDDVCDTCDGDGEVTYATDMSSIYEIDGQLKVAAYTTDAVAREIA